MTGSGESRLFERLTIRSVTLRNRTVLSPMVQYAARGGVASEHHLVHLGKFAMGGFGVVFTESVAVNETGRITEHDLALFNDEQQQSLKPVVAAISRYGAVPAIQLGHAGRKAAMQRAMDGNGPLDERDFAANRRAWDIVGPTSTPVAPGWLIPREMSEMDITTTLQSFVEATKRADAAGFKILEIHAAHGYLLASFLSAASNKRTDRYGGDLAGRMRFPLEVVAAVRSAWPRAKPLFVRISALDGANGWTLQDSVALSIELSRIGVDVVDCSSGGISSASSASIIPRGLGFQVPFASAIRRSAPVMTQAVGLILSATQAEAIVQDGDADLIAIGREALYNPYWPAHAAQTLNSDPDFSLLNDEDRWWLGRRKSVINSRAS